MNSARTRAYIQLLIATVIWGIASPVIKFTLGGFDSLTFLTYRFGLSSILALGFFIFAKEHLPKEKGTLLSLIGYGFLTSTVSLGFLFFGLENTTVLDSSLITLANPLLVSVAGVLFLAEHITKREKIGMGIALLGTALTVIEPILENHGGGIRLSGNIFIVGYLIANAWAVVIGKKLLRENVSPLLMTNISFVIGFISLLPFTLILTKTNITQVAIPYHLGVFFMAFLSGTYAYYLYQKAQKTVEVGDAAIFSYLYPLFSTPLAVFWLGEKITPLFILGGVIIAIGVAIAEIKKKRYNSSSD